jgi:O-antigen/teichoic acid export membrane protein
MIGAGEERAVAGEERGVAGEERAVAGDVLSTAAAGPSAVRGGAFRIGGYIVGALLGALSAALLFRHLGKIDTGRYVLATSLVAIVGALSDLGLTSVGVREVATRPAHERWQVARDLLGLRLLLTLVGGAIVTVVAGAAYSATMAAGVALASVGLLVQTTLDNFFLSLTVDLRYGLISAIEVSRQALTTACMILLVLLGARLVPFLAVPIPVGLIALVPTVWIVRGHRSLLPTFDRRRWWKLLSAVLPYAAAVAASALYLRVSILLVSALSSRAQLGDFGASYRMIEVLILIPGLLVSAAFPIFARAARDDRARLGYALGRVLEVALLLGAWMAVTIAVGAGLFVEVIGGAEFKSAAPVLAIQGVALGIMFVSMVWASGLLSLGLYRQILLLNVAGLVLNGALVAALVSVDGARGAAIGTALAELAGALAQATVLIRGRPQLRPPLRVLPRVTLAAALGLTPLAMPGVPILARLAISSGLFAATVVATRALPTELRALLPNSSLWARVVGG